MQQQVERNIKCRGEFASKHFLRVKVEAFIIFKKITQVKKKNKDRKHHRMKREIESVMLENKESKKKEDFIK